MTVTKELKTKMKEALDLFEEKRKETIHLSLARQREIQAKWGLNYETLSEEEKEQDAAEIRELNTLIDLCRKMNPYSLYLKSNGVEIETIGLEGENNEHH